MCRIVTANKIDPREMYNLEMQVIVDSNIEPRELIENQHNCPHLRVAL